MKYCIALFVCFLSIKTQAQLDDSKWFINVGVNAINNLQSQNPLYKPGEWAVNNPFAISVERKILNRFFIEAAYTNNGFNKDDSDTDLLITDDFNYQSFDFNAKLYYGDQIFKNTDWIDLYFNLGGGITTIDDQRNTFNVGGGILFWLNQNRNIGVRLQSTAKVALGKQTQNNIDSNHYQYHIQAVFKL